MKSCSFALLFAALVFAPGATRAQTVTIHMNPAQTHILWTLPDVLHTVHGTFHLSSGTITFNAKNGEASGFFSVDEDTGASGDNIRDNRMKKSILETATHPTATFKPTHVSGVYNLQGSSTLLVDGIFNLHGADHPLKLAFQVTAKGSAITATTKFDIPYVSWGMHDPSTLFLRVDKSVQMEIDAAGTVQTAP